jgi:hypothetical protein
MPVLLFPQLDSYSYAGTAWLKKRVCFGTGCHLHTQQIDFVAYQQNIWIGGAGWLGWEHSRLLPTYRNAKRILGGAE